MSEILEPSTPFPPQPRIVLIEDQTLIRQVLQLTLKRERGWTDVRDYGNGEEGLQHCLAEPADLVILDLDLPGKNGWEIAQELRQHSPRTRILMLTANMSSKNTAQMMELGINGYVDKTAPYEHLLHAIDVVMAGALFFSARPGEAAVAEPGNEASAASRKKKEIDPRQVLNEEELAIARLVVAGLSSKEIAEMRGLTARSVDKHRANIMEKLGVRQVASMVRLLVMNGIV